MNSIKILDRATDFAEDKDVAADIREQELRPALERGEEVEIDFSGVKLTTQSFVHALLGDPLRFYGEGLLALVAFRNCERSVRGIIETVVQYNLEAKSELEKN